MQFFRGNAFKNFKVGVSGAVGIRGGGNILAQVVEAGHHAPVVAITSGGYGLI